MKTTQAQWGILRLQYAVEFQESLSTCLRILIGGMLACVESYRLSPGTLLRYNFDRIKCTNLKCIAWLFFVYMCVCVLCVCVYTKCQNAFSPMSVSLCLYLLAYFHQIHSAVMCNNKHGVLVTEQDRCGSHS